MSASESEDDGTFDLFKEPEGYYGPEKQPTTASYTTISGHQLSLRLVGHSPLWVGDNQTGFIPCILRSCTYDAFQHFMPGVPLRQFVPDQLMASRAIFSGTPATPLQYT